MRVTNSSVLSFHVKPLVDALASPHFHLPMMCWRRPACVHCDPCPSVSLALWAPGPVIAKGCWAPLQTRFDHRAVTLDHWPGAHGLSD